MYTIFDSHAHYNDRRFDEDRETVLQTLPTQGVTAVLNCGTTLDSSEICLRMAEQWDYLYAACGVHPHEAQQEADKIEILPSLLKHPKCVAVGEIGLDYHYDFSPREIQKEVFERQLILAEKTGYPILVHDREAHGPTMELISKHSAIGVMHSFSGSGEMAKELVKKGWYVSYSGSVTFKNAVNLAETVQYVPDDRLLLETDAPFLAPVPYRGNTNISKYTYATAQKLADLRQVDISHIIKITSENAKRIFNID